MDLVCRGLAFIKVRPRPRAGGACKHEGGTKAGEAGGARHRLVMRATVRWGVCTARTRHCAGVAAAAPAQRSCTAV